MHEATIHQPTNNANLICLKHQHLTRRLSIKRTTLKSFGKAVFFLYALLLINTPLHAESYIAEIDFTATIDRISVPTGESSPEAIEIGSSISGKFKFVEGKKNELITAGGYNWRTSDNRPTATLQLDAPFSTEFVGIFLVLTGDTMISVVTGTSVYLPKISGDGIKHVENEFWSPIKYSLQAPGKVNPEYSQIETIQRLVEIAGEGNVKMVVNYARKPGDTDLLRVILSVDSMSLL